MRFVRQFIIAVIFFSLMKTYFYPAIIPSESMTPTLLVNDYVLYLKTGNIKVNDIILFQLDNQGEFITKRVIAIGNKEGTKIEVKDESVYVNNEKVNEKHSNMKQGFTMKEKILQEGEIFVMGDNRSNSADSRIFGHITKDEVKGKIFLRIPMGKIIKEADL